MKRPTATTTLPRPAGLPSGADAGSSIDPRIRERRAGVLRSEARRRLRRALAVVGVVALVAGSWALLHSGLFSARVITVVGSAHTPQAQVTAAAGLARHPPLLDVDVAAAAAAVERLPWVRWASVERQWPDGVRITVAERRPSAVVAEPPPAHGWALVDRTGRVLAVAAVRPAGLVEVSGAAVTGRPGSTLRTLRGAVAVASSLPKAFAAQVGEISEASDGTVTLHLTSPVTVYLGSTSNLHQKYEDVAALLAQAQLRAGDVIDVSAPATPVVRP